MADGDLGSNLFRFNGATLIVIYSDPGDPAPYRLIVYDGLDLAYGIDPTPGPTRVTVPVTFSHGAEAAARQAQLLVSSGDARPAGRTVSASATTRAWSTASTAPPATRGTPTGSR